MRPCRANAQRLARRLGRPRWYCPAMAVLLRLMSASAAPDVVGRLLTDADVPAGLLAQRDDPSPPAQRLAPVAAGREVWYLVSAEPWARAGRVVLDERSGAIVSYEAPLPRYLPAGQVGREALRRAAARFLERWQPRGWSALQPAPFQEPRHGDTLCAGALLFTRCWASQGVQLPFDARVGARVWDGRVSLFFVNDVPVTAPLVRRLTPTDAEAVARRWAAEQGLVLTAQVTCTEAIRPAADGAQRHRYEFLWRCAPDRESRVDQVLLCCVNVDALNGEVCYGRTMEYRAEDVAALAAGRALPLKPSPELVKDEWPCWWRLPDGEEALVFVSNRSVPGAPHWRMAAGANLLAATLRTGRLLCLASSVEQDLYRPALSGNRLVAGHASSFSPAALFDLGSGQRCELSSGLYRRTCMSLGGGGTAAAYVALAGADEATLWTCEVKATTLGRPYRVSSLSGELLLPTLSPDGRKVYFVRRLAGRADAVELWCVPAGKSFWVNDPPTLLARDLELPQRLSMSADGSHLLLGQDTRLSQLDVRTGELTSRALPEVPDPDRADGEPLMLLEPTLSPSGDHMAFAAEHWAKGKEAVHGTYIYTCRWDGSELRRVTPLEDILPRAYIFPGTGRAAVEVQPVDEALLGRPVPSE